MSDDLCLKVVELYLDQKKRGAAGGNLASRCVRAARETSYQWKAERCMADENCFKVPASPGAVGVGRGAGAPAGPHRATSPKEPPGLGGWPGEPGVQRPPAPCR